MGAEAASSPYRLEAVLSTRVPAGFGDQIRAAARAEGVRPGALIRDAVSERIARAGALIAIKTERGSLVSGQEA